MDFKDKRVKYTVIFCAVLLVIIGWRIFSNVSKNREKARKSAEIRAVNVVAAVPVRKDIKPEIRLSGSLDPVWQADVGAKIVARVEKVYADVGDNVEKGQVLAQMEQTDLGASAATALGNYYDAQGAYATAEAHFNRYARLVEKGAVSKSDYDNALFSLNMAEGKVKAAKGAYDLAMSKLEGTKIIAPAKGTIVKKYYQEGYYAKEGTALFNIADTSSLRVKLDIPEGQIGYVEKNAKVKVEIPALNKNVEGVITKLAQVADLPARTFAAEVTIPNADNAIRGGLSGNIYIRTKEKKNAMILPQSAIVLREDQRTVYVVGEDKKIIRRVLDTGFIGDGIVEVLSGITEKDEVVLTGQNRIKEGTLVKIVKPEEMQKPEKTEKDANAK